MKKSLSVCVLAINFIGSVFAELKPEEYISKYGYLAEKPGRKLSEKSTPEEMVKVIPKFQSFNELPKTGMNDESTANTFTPDIYGKYTNTVFTSTVLNTEVELGNEQKVGFCNFSYSSINAAMSINGIGFVFVDKGEVIDGRTGQKTTVQSLFLGGPTWVQAAVYSEEYTKAYLFKDDKVWTYLLYSDFHFRGVLPNFNKRSHSPECAIIYNDKIFLLKNRTFFRFKPYVENVDKQGTKTLGNISIQNNVDAAISSGYDIKFIMKDNIIKVSDKMEVELIQTNLVFNKCTKNNELFI